MTPILRTLLLAAPCFGLLAGAAMAGERPRRMPPPAERAEQGFDWTGAYFGLNAGYAAGSGRARDGRASADDRYPPSRTRVRP
jgi:outer membrane immunogenic protein